MELKGREVDDEMRETIEVFYERYDGLIMKKMKMVMCILSSSVVYIIYEM